mmetsp:Transcript_24370/g.28681  ORF Transcript_24370/g.28681 Transcript_24370/m.28681 type:complete len:226 (+) Transcript_24370:2918-3595(+)
MVQSPGGHKQRKPTIQQRAKRPATFVEDRPYKKPYQIKSMSEVEKQPIAPEVKESPKTETDQPSMMMEVEESPKTKTNQPNMAMKEAPNDKHDTNTATLEERVGTEIELIMVPVMEEGLTKLREQIATQAEATKSIAHRNPCPRRLHTTTSAKTTSALQRKRGGNLKTNKLQSDVRKWSHGGGSQQNAEDVWTPKTKNHDDTYLSQRTQRHFLRNRRNGSTRLNY